MENKAASSRRGLKVFLVIFALAVCVFLLLDFHTPRYHGKSARYWLDQTNSPEEVAAAVAAFKAMGKPGVLYLVGELESKPRGESLLVKLAESRLPMPEFVAEALVNFSRPPADHSSDALRIFKLLGRDADVALPSLMRIFAKDARNERIMADFEVAEALDSLGDRKAAYIPDFLRALDECRWEPNASEVIYLLGSIGPKAKSVIPALLAVMPAGSKVLTNAVASALWSIDRQTNFVLGIFTNELMTERADYITQPLGHLADMGPAAMLAVPLILELITNSDETVRDAAATALAKIDPPLLRSTIDDINKNSAARIDELIKMIREGGRDSARALMALPLYGSEAKAAVPALIEVLESSPPKTTFPGLKWQMAIDAVAVIGPDARDAVPALIALLPVKRIDIDALDLCRALGNIGSDAVSAVPDLRKLLSDSDPRRRLGAATALARIDPAEKLRLAPILKELTNSHLKIRNGLFNPAKDTRVALRAKIALWRLGLEKTLPIEEMTHRTNDWNPFTALPLLGDIGPPAKSALPFLEDIAENDREILYRRLAATAIRKIDPQEAARLKLPGILGLP